MAEGGRAESCPIEVSVMMEKYFISIHQNCSHQIDLAIEYLECSLCTKIKTFQFYFNLHTFNNHMLGVIPILDSVGLEKFQI